MAQDPNQGPEQQARDRIDDQLRQAGWIVQDRQNLAPNAGPGVAVREYPTDAGPMDYLLLVDDQPAPSPTSPTPPTPSRSPLANFSEMDSRPNRSMDPGFIDTIR